MGWGVSRTPAPRRDTRQVMVYGAAVLGLALAVMAVAAGFSAGESFHCTADSDTAQQTGAPCLSASQYALVFAPPAILAAGALGALGRTLVVWRRGGPWMLWHAAMWFLLVVMIVYVGVAGTALMS